MVNLEIEAKALSQRAEALTSGEGATHEATVSDQDPMRLIHVDAVGVELGETRTWLVIADSLFGALSLIPPDYMPRAAAVQATTIPGPARIIGWLGQRSVAVADGQSDRNPIPASSLDLTGDHCACLLASCDAGQG